MVPVSHIRYLLHVWLCFARPESVTFEVRSLKPEDSTSGPSCLTFETSNLTRLPHWLCFARPSPGVGCARRPSGPLALFRTDGLDRLRWLCFAQSGQPSAYCLRPPVCFPANWLCFAPFVVVTPSCRPAAIGFVWQSSAKCLPIPQSPGPPARLALSRTARSRVLLSAICNLKSAIARASGPAGWLCFAESVPFVATHGAPPPSAVLPAEGGWATSDAPAGTPQTAPTASVGFVSHGYPRRPGRAFCHSAIPRPRLALFRIPAVARPLRPRLATGVWLCFA